MILKQQNNSPLSAPQISDIDIALAAFRTWKGFAFLNVEDLYSFMNQPGPEREEFLKTLSVSSHFVKTYFAVQTFE